MSKAINTNEVRRRLLDVSKRALGLASQSELALGRGETIVDTGRAPKIGVLHSSDSLDSRSQQILLTHAYSRHAYVN